MINIFIFTKKKKTNISPIITEHNRVGKIGTIVLFFFWYNSNIKGTMVHQSPILYNLRCQKILFKTLRSSENKINFDNETLNWFNKFSPENVNSGETNSVVPMLVQKFPHEQ